MVKLKLRYPVVKVGMDEICGVCSRRPILFYAEVSYWRSKTGPMVSLFCKDCYFKYVGFKNLKIQECYICKSSDNITYEKSFYSIDKSDDTWLNFCKECFEQHSGFEIEEP